jgi:hypothetical protein
MNFMLTYAQKVLVLTQTVKVTATERKGAKVLVDHIQQVLGRRKTQGNVRSVRGESIVRGFHLMAC